MKNKYLKAFFLTFIILLIILLVLGIYPFGDKTLIVSDLRDQYMIFINYLKSIFFGSNTFLYTFSGSLGENFLSLAAYYLMSPFNLITLFFKTSLMPLVITFIILFKISLSSVTMLYYLNDKVKDKKIIYFFSLSYALMSYTIAFYFHIMWLDSIILLPLMVKGIENIVEKKNSLLYIFSLSLIIFSNYYIGVITCIFSVMYFIYYILLTKEKEYKKIIIKYLVSSLLSGLMCSFILIPVFYSMLNGKALVDDINTVTPYYFNSLDIFSKLFNSSYDASSIWHGGANVFVGSFCLVLFSLSFFNKKTDKRVKIINLIFILILFLTLRIHKFDLIFHGLTEPNCFDFRHAFIIGFMLIKIASENYDNFDLKKKKMSITLFIFLIIHLIIYLNNYSYYQGMRSLLLLFSLISIILITLSLYYKKEKFLLLLIILDLMVNTTNIFKTIMDVEYKASDLKLFNSYYKENSLIINKIKEDDKTFYRIEKDYHHSNSINDSMLFNYYGISHFDSTSNVNTEKFLENIGFRRMMSRAFYDHGSTKMVDMLLGIKYVLSKDNNYKDYQKISSGVYSVYQNPYYISMGFKLENLNNLEYSDNVFENLNLVYQNIMNKKDSLYERANYNISYLNVNRKDNIYEKKKDDAFITYTFKVMSDDDYYLYFKDNLVRDNFKTGTIYVNNREINDYFNKYHYGMIYLGKFNIGETVDVKIKVDNDYLEFPSGLIYYENNDIFYNLYNYLKSNSLNINLINSSSIEFSSNFNVNNNVLVSIPYEKGWNIYIDGVKTDYQSGLNGLISFSVSKGNHYIKMNYLPLGLKFGIIVSLLAFTGTIIWIRGEKDEKENRI